jgi:hypothetical protein
MNQLESLPLTVGPDAREPGRFSPLVEKDGVPNYTKLEGTSVIPHPNDLSLERGGELLRHSGGRKGE